MVAWTRWLRQFPVFKNKPLKKIQVLLTYVHRQEISCEKFSTILTRSKEWWANFWLGSAGLSYKSISGIPWFLKHKIAHIGSRALASMLRYESNKLILLFVKFIGYLLFFIFVIIFYIILFILFILLILFYLCLHILWFLVICFVFYSTNIVYPCLS